MRILHTSPTKITKIDEFGLFDDCLFFSVDEYAMGSAEVLYALEIDESKIIKGRDLDEENSFVADAILDLKAACCDVLDEDDVFDILSNRENLNEFVELQECAETSDKIGSLCWEVQRLQGWIARMLGFDAFETRDEQGSVYIVPMRDKLERLERIR